MKGLVKDWDSQITILSTIEETQLQAADSAFASGFKNKLGRTIPNICHLLLHLERTIKNTFIPDVTGGQICNDKEGLLISLLIRHGGLFIPIFPETAEIIFMNSSKITSELTKLIKQQSLHYNIHGYTRRQSKEIQNQDKEVEKREI